MMLHIFRVNIPFSVKNLKHTHGHTRTVSSRRPKYRQMTITLFCLTNGILICLGMQIEVHHVWGFFFLVSFRLPPSQFIISLYLSLPYLPSGELSFCWVCDLPYSMCHPYLKHSQKSPFGFLTGLFLSSQLLTDSASSCFFYKDLTSLQKDEMFPSKWKKGRWLVS